MKTFREQWQRELQISPKHTSHSQTNNQSNINVGGKENLEEKKIEKYEDNSIEVKVDFYLVIKLFQIFSDLTLNIYITYRQRIYFYKA